MSTSYGVTTPQGTFTADEFARLERPPCPVCGTAVDWARIDVTTEWHYRQTGQHQYIVGRWACPNDCDPVTGKRHHYNLTVFNDGEDGRGFRCSCGVERFNLSDARFRELIAEHTQDLGVRHADLR